MHGGVNDAIGGHPETPCPFSSTNDDANDIRLKHNADAFVKGAVTTIMSSRAWTRHSAIFIVADEGDFTGNAVNGGWDSPAGCCDSPVLPKGDPDISASWPGGLYGGALVPAVVIDPSGPRHFVSDTALQPLLAAAHHRGRLGPARARLHQRPRPGHHDERIPRPLRPAAAGPGLAVAIDGRARPGIRHRI